MVEDKAVVKKGKRISSHQRMRLETVKVIQSAKKKAQNRRSNDNPLEDNPHVGTKVNLDKESKTIVGTLIKVRQPRIKKNTLREPPVPKAKFRKRQLNKTWLPTHLYHAKRAHMSPAKEPLWRFAIPLRPTEKCYRQTHRASTSRGTIAWDTSYVSTIGLQGVEKSLINLLKALGVGCADEDKTIWTRSRTKWIRGTRAWHGMLFKRQAYPLDCLCPATIIWNPIEEVNHNDESHEITAKQPKRKLLIHAHPSAFLQLWEEVLRLSKVQKPSVAVEDLRYEIGSIEIKGPSSTEALVGILKPVIESNGAQSDSNTIGVIWNSLKLLQNPSMLPKDVVVAFEASDPRLNPRSQNYHTSDQNLDELFQVCSKWPLDTSIQPISLFDRDRRQKASQLLKSQKSINRRKSSLNPGQTPQIQQDDPKIPVLLFTQQHSSSGQGVWTLLLPWRIVQTVWYALMHYPLSIGSTPRFGGLVQSRQTMYESGRPWFPADFPGTEAGMKWEMHERANAKAEWERRPKGRRIEFTSLDLGMGRKGEIGDGWACDWERLLNGQAGSGSYLTNFDVMSL
jgi:ribonuclease P/MRP protein subunit POP1